MVDSCARHGVGCGIVSTGRLAERSVESTGRLAEWLVEANGRLAEWSVEATGRLAEWSVEAQLRSVEATGRRAEWSADAQLSRQSAVLAGGMVRVLNDSPGRGAVERPGGQERAQCDRGGGGLSDEVGFKAKLIPWHRAGAPWRARHHFLASELPPHVSPFRPGRVPRLKSLLRWDSCGFSTPKFSSASRH